MLIALAEFEALFEDRILSRGLSYHQEGLVLELERRTDTAYRARVDGSSVYRVDVELDQNANILSLDCDCPYDLGEFCKHEAAVLYLLREELASSDMDQKEPASSKIEALLHNLTKEQLIEILRSVLEDHPALEKQLLYRFGNQTAGLQESRELIQSCIRSAQGHYGEMDDLGAVIGAMETVLERAQSVDDVRATSSLYAMVIQEAIGLYDHLYDDEGCEVSEIIEQAAAGLFKTAEMLKDSADIALRQDFFRHLLDAVAALENWGWDNDLTTVCLWFCDQPVCRQQLESFYETRLQRASEGYTYEHIKGLQLQMIRQLDSPAQAEKFLKENINLPSFRKASIEKAMEQQNYEQALTLAKDGEEQDRQAFGLRKQWRVCQLDAYLAMNDGENACRIMRMFLLDGDIAYHEPFKAYYSKEAWRAERDCILLELEKKSHPGAVYEHFLTAEGMEEKLMAHCEKHTNRIFALYTHLGAAYRSRVDQVFQSALRYRAQNASSRSHYKDLCGQLKIYRKAIGTAEAVSFANQLREQYRRKPALLDELGKAGF